MYFALDESDLLPAVFGGTASIVLTALEALLAAILLLTLALWLIQRLATRHDPPNDPMSPLL